jgi:hypothetical protein
MKVCSVEALLMINHLSRVGYLIFVW